VSARRPPGGSDYTSGMKPGLLFLLAALASPVMAQDAIEFRCTDEAGQVTVQDRPCPSGAAQIIQRKGASAAATVTTAVAAEPRVLDSDALPEGGFDVDGPGLLDSDVLRLRREEATQQDAADGPPKPPLPEIYQCVGADGSQYLHEYDAAPPRCVALTVSGLGGGVVPANAASCEVVRDTCEALPEAQRCGAWQQRFRTARGRERFATEGNLEAARSERARLQAVLDASGCAVPQ